MKEENNQFDARKDLSSLMSADEDLKPDPRFVRKPSHSVFTTRWAASAVFSAIQEILNAEKRHIDTSIIPPLSEFEVKYWGEILNGTSRIPSLSDCEAIDTRIIE